MQIIDRIKSAYHDYKEIQDERIDNALNTATMKAYEKYYPRWCKICEVQNKDDIDYKNPVVELESRLCDPRNLKMIRNGVHEDDFLKLLSEDAQHLYLEEVDEEGNRYTDLRHPRFLKSLCKRISKQLHSKDVKDALEDWANSD